MEANAGKISVIIAIYNVAPYLRQCLDSIVNQTYHNLEILCVDDGSTDESGSICDEYAARDERIRVIHQKNGGSAAARNAGLDACTGDLISIVDGDDWLELTMYQTLMELYSDPSVDIAAGGYSMDYPDRCEIIENLRPVPETPCPIRDFLYYIYRRDLYRGVASYLWNKLFPRKFFDGTVARIRFSLDLGSQGDDIYLAAQCFVLANVIHYTPFPVYHYRQRENSAFQSAIGKRLDTLNHLHAYEKIIQLYEENNISSEALDYVKRFYVYHAGLLLEYALKIGNTEKIHVLQEKIRPYLPVYEKTNADHPERYQWICQLLNAK